MWNITNIDNYFLVGPVAEERLDVLIKSLAKDSAGSAVDDKNDSSSIVSNKTDTGKWDY